VACLVLAVHGVADEYGSTRHSEVIAALCGGPVHVEIMADTNHVPHREHPEDVINFIYRFICQPTYPYPQKATYTSRNPKQAAS
jgi:pimeloyl-ACP methyl ester carboxylesterase